MAGSHEVRGSIPLGSTKFSSRLHGRLFYCQGKGNHGSANNQRKLCPGLVHLTHRFYHRVHRFGRRPVRHLAVPLPRIAAWRRGISHPLPLLRGVAWPHRRRRRDVVRPRHANRPHGRIRQSAVPAQRPPRERHRQDHRHRTGACRTRHRHRLHRGARLVFEIPRHCNNGSAACARQHGCVLWRHHRRFRKRRLACCGAHHHAGRHGAGHLTRHRASEQGHDAPVLRAVRGPACARCVPARRA